MNKSLYKPLKFDSLLHVLLGKVLPTLNDKNIHIDLSTSSDIYFIDKVRELTALNVKLYRSKPDNNYPQIDSASIKVEDGDLSTLTGIGKDIMRRPYSDIATLTSKAEFLERLSSALPLDHAVEVEHDIDKIFDLIKSKKLKVKSLLNKDTLYKNYEDIYYYLSRHIKISKDNNDVNKNTQMSSNGCAGHFDYDQAVLSAWLEYIQRDGFLVHWLNTISPKVIDVTTYLQKEKQDTDLSKIIKDFNKYNIEYYFVDITSDINVPNVLCVIISDVRGGRRIHIGAGTGFDADKAFLSAAIEAIASATFKYKVEAQSFNIKNYKPFTDKSIDKNKRQDIYYEKDMIKNIDFIFKSKEKISVEDWVSVNGAIKKLDYDIIKLEKDPKYQLQYLKEIFKKRMVTNPNYNVYVYEYKNKLIKYWDYKVVRVICPELYSLYLNESYANPEHPRLKEFVINKGLESQAKLNIWPHLFP